MKIATTKTVTQVFYTTKFALSIQTSKNGHFFEIAPSLSSKDKTFNWDQKVTVKFSISELCNLGLSLETFRLFGADAYTKTAQELFGEKYKNMQFIHINRKGNQVRTGFNLYNNSLSFIINNQKEKVDLKFPVLPTERLRLERFIYKIVDLALEEPSSFEAKNNSEDPETDSKVKKFIAPASPAAPKDNILAFINTQNDKVLTRMKEKLYQSETHSDIEKIRDDFYHYCRNNKFNFSFVEIETIFREFESKLEDSLLK